MPRRTQPQLQAEIGTLIEDNDAGLISEADVRSVLDDGTDSYVFLGAHEALVARVDALEGGAPPPVQTTRTVYFGTSPDAVPQGAELTVEGADGIGVVDAYAGEMHLIVARLATEGDITSLTFSDDQSNTNQIGAFSKYNAEVIPAGQAESFAAWVSNQPLSQTADLTITAR